VLRIELSPSPALAGATLLAHGAAAACLAAVVPGVAGWPLAALVLALGAASAWNRALLRGARAVRAIRWLAPEEAEFLGGDGTSVRAPIAPGGSVNRFWVTLRAGAPVRRTILIAADMADPRAFRALRLWALWGRAGELNAKPAVFRR
jgi:hypothetical protein